MSTVYIVSIIFWLVVLTILKNISQWEGLSHILWTIKNVWSTGWWYTYPSEKYDFASWDYEIPNLWENKIHVPNHQPVNIVSINFPYISTQLYMEYVWICGNLFICVAPHFPRDACIKVCQVDPGGISIHLKVKVPRLARPPTWGCHGGSSSNLTNKTETIIHPECLLLLYVFARQRKKWTLYFKLWYVIVIDASESAWFFINENGTGLRDYNILQ